MNDIVIKNLQEENTKLGSKVTKLETCLLKIESDQNSLIQYGRRNNAVLTGIPETVKDNELEDVILTFFNDIDVNVQSSDIEVCHRFDKPDQQKSKKTIIRLINRKNAKNVVVNKI